MNNGSNKKRTLIIISLLVACLSLIALPTSTFIRKQILSKNLITMMDKGVEIELLEYRLNDSGEEVPFQNIDGILPKQIYSKIVKVKNNGDIPAYIRIKVDIAITFPTGEQEMLSDDSLVKLDYSDKWQKSGDYWYYPLPLPSQDITEPLFKTVSFSSDMGQKYMNSSINVHVKSYATQVEHNGNNVFEAQGWPAD